MDADDDVFTIAQAARKLKVSVRWLTDQCRTGKVEHLHMAGRRRFTQQQIDAIKAANTIGVGQKTKTRKRIPPQRTGGRQSTTGEVAS